MEILFISNLMSEFSYKKLCGERTIQRVEPSQKFFNLIIQGMAKTRAVNIHCLSVLPVYHSIYRKLLIHRIYERALDNLSYEYVGFINYPGFKQATVYFNILYAIKRWIKSVTDKDRVIIIDPMLVEATHAAIKLAKKTGTKCVAFVTDVPSLTFRVGNSKCKAKYIEISDNDLTKFDNYILLTNEMNALFNIANRKSLVIESVVPVEYKYQCKNKCKDMFTIMYAGKLHAKFGARNLVKAMEYLDDPSIRLEVYGDGDSVEEIKAAQEKDDRIIYGGVIPVEAVEKRLSEVALLVNPRPTGDRFTKYSFPSKTVEYMSSGTPFASTVLPGIPKEYFDYIIPIQNESPEGIALVIEYIKQNYEQALLKADAGQQFVLSKKNNIMQGERIVEFLREICKQD